MARERYLLDDTEDTIHKNEIKPQTASDKRKNWWDYHKVHVLLVALAIAVVGYFIYSVTSKTEPDYTITVMTQYTVPSDLQTDIQELFEKYADDRNGDGKTYVAMNFCRFNTSGTSEFETANFLSLFNRTLLLWTRFTIIFPRLPTECILHGSSTIVVESIFKPILSADGISCISWRTGG